MDDKILNLFRESKDRFISGEELSRLLGVTRAAVWKHIEKLRLEGYAITAEPHHGYKLVQIPDKLLSDEIRYKLKTRLIGRRIYSYSIVDSTNDTAWQMAEKGEPEGSVVVSETQKKGKGRLGRHWSSPEGGIYLSVILRPNITPTESSKLTLTAAVSTALAIRAVTGLDARIKWPNDILLDNKKACGILTEMSAEADLVHFIILGIGINVNTDVADLPRGSVSLAGAAGREFSRVDLARMLLGELDRHYQELKAGKFMEIIEQWRELSATLGCRVRVKVSKGILEGQAMDVDEAGALVVRLDNGFQERVLAGDVVLMR